jgi:hypothetical protein
LSKTAISINFRLDNDNELNCKTGINFSLGSLKMIAADQQEFLRAFGQCPIRPVSTMAAAMLVNTKGFQISQEAAQDNVYMGTQEVLDLPKAQAQHAEISRVIQEIGVPTLCFTGVEGFEDGIFPNNAYGTTPGKLIIGHMFHPVRQQETQRKDIRDFFATTLGYQIHDLSTQPGICELTGSLVIDRARNIGFCGLSNRADALGCKAMEDAFALDYCLSFELVPSEYHTNIVMAILAGRLVFLYPPAFVDPEVPKLIKNAYGDCCHFITEHEKNQFVGNCIAVTKHDVLFSKTALNAMSRDTFKALASADFNIHSVDIDELEKGGGSMRCTIAEVF